MTDVVVLVPMLGRPWTVAPMVQSLVESKAPAELLFVVGVDDHEVLAACQQYPVLKVRRRMRGDYARKINAGVRATDSPWLFFGACDIRFHAGWWESCMTVAAGGAKVIGTNDLCNPLTATGKLSTHSVVSRDYAELPCIDGSPGPLYRGYIHEYSDNELRGTAIKRGAWGHAPDAIVEHLHPTAGKAEWDESYAGQGSRMRTDRGLYGRRRRLWQ